MLIIASAAKKTATYLLNMAVLLCLLATYPLYSETDADPEAKAPTKKPIPADVLRRTYRVYPDVVTNLKLPNGHSKPSYILLRIELVAIKESDVALLEKHQPLYIDSYLAFIHDHAKDNLNTPTKRANFLRASAKVIDRTLRVETGRSVIQKMVVRKMLIE